MEEKADDDAEPAAGAAEPPAGSPASAEAEAGGAPEDAVSGLAVPGAAGEDEPMSE